MKKSMILMMALAIIVPLSALAQGQEKPSAMTLVLSQKKPRPVQLQLSGASPSCGGVMDCDEEFHQAGGALADPCLSDRLACHLESFSRSKSGQAWLVGGAKLQAEIGPVKFSIGRHKDIFVLSRSPFIEGTYKTGFRSTVSVGVLQTPLAVGSQNLWYIVLRKTL